MFLHRWFSHRLDRIADSVRSASDATFDAALAKINALAATVSRWMSWAPDRDESPMSMDLYGSADAVGEHTAAHLDFDGTLTDHGAVSVGVARCTAQAAAKDGPMNPQELVEVEASSNIQGADFVLTFDHLSVGRNHATASHTVVAIDFAFYEAPSHTAISHSSEAKDEEVLEVAEGNRADILLDFDVGDDDSLLDVVAQAVVIEDRFSATSVDATLAIG